MKVLRSTKGEGSGAPGTVLDDNLTIACGDGAVRLTQVQRAGRQPMSGGGISARHAGQDRRRRWTEAVHARESVASSIASS